jgi:PilZ domain
VLARPEGPSADHGARTYSGVWASRQAASGPGSKGRWKYRHMSTLGLVQRFLKTRGRKGLIGARKSEIMPAPKKREARKLLGQSAWITLDGGFAVRQCVVQDISSAGAKISLNDAATLPASLRLAFSRDARTGHKCQVVWRSGKSAGVKFVR